jgi:hypothetical protein
MAHYAEVNQKNIVIRVIVVNNAEVMEGAVESEKKGKDFIAKHLPGNWIQTSYSAKKRGKFAAIGDFYDKAKDAFIPPKPFESWTLDAKNVWVAPVKQTVKMSNWNESSKSWVSITRKKT